jgi:hypothetical protein
VRLKESEKMVCVEFERSGYNEKVGPVPWVELNAGGLRVGPDNRTAASYHGGVWDVGANEHVVRFHIHGSRCMVRCGFDRTKNPIYGPFDKVEVVDGAVYTEPDSQLLARLDEGNQLWFTYEDRRYWPALVIEEGEE